MTKDLPKGCRLISLASHGDARGALISIEGNRHIPFPIARVYYIHRTEWGVERGFHAHYALRQLAIAVSGSCAFTLDDGSRRETVRLDKPTEGLILGPMIWREMSDFSADCVLMVLADAAYDEADYIRNYGGFLAATKASPL